MNKIFIIILIVIIICLLMILLDKISSIYIKENFKTTTQTQNGKCFIDSDDLKFLRDTINSDLKSNIEEGSTIIDKSTIMNKCIEIINTNFTNLQGCSNNEKYKLCKDVIIDNFKLDNHITTLQVVDIDNNDIRGKVDEVLSLHDNEINNLVINDKIRGLEEASELNDVINKYNVAKKILLNQIHDINLYKDRNNNAITKILNNESTKTDLNIKRDIIYNKKKQIENLVDLINKSDNNDNSIHKIKNKFNNYIILDTKVVLRYYDITNNMLLSLDEVRQYRDEGKGNHTKQYYNKNDYYKLLMNDTILLYEPINRSDNKPCLEYGSLTNNCIDWPQNMCNSYNPSHNCWYKALTNGNNNFNEKIQEIREDETQNNQFSTMEYIPELYKQGGYFNLVNLTSAIYKTIFNDEKNNTEESYIIVPANEDFNNITKIVGTNANSNLVIIDIKPYTQLSGIPDYYIWNKI